MKRCPSSPVISDIQTKVTTRYHLLPSHRQKSGSWMRPSSGQDVGILESLGVRGLVQPLWRAVRGHPAKPPRARIPDKFACMSSGATHEGPCCRCLWQWVAISGERLGTRGGNTLRDASPGPTERTNVHVATGESFPNAVCAEAAETMRAVGRTRALTTPCEWHSTHRSHSNGCRWGRGKDVGNGSQHSECRKEGGAMGLRRSQRRSTEECDERGPPRAAGGLLGLCQLRCHSGPEPWADD